MPAEREACTPAWKAGKRTGRARPGQTAAFQTSLQSSSVGRAGTNSVLLSCSMPRMGLLRNRKQAVLKVTMTFSSHVGLWYDQGGACEEIFGTRSSFGGSHVSIGMLNGRVPTGLVNIAWGPQAKSDGSLSIWD